MQQCERYDVRVEGVGRRGDTSVDGAPARAPAGSADPLARLVPAAKDGDRDATRRLLEGVSPRVAGVARRILGPDDPDVADAVQESLVALVRALDAFEGRASVVGYATRISVLTCLRMQRRARAARERAEHHASIEIIETDGRDAALAARRRAAARELLATLPEEQAETLAYRFVLGMSLEEVAEATSVPINTVRSRVRLAKEALRARLRRRRDGEDLGGEP